MPLHFTISVVYLCDESIDDEELFFCRSDDTQFGNLTALSLLKGKWPPAIWILCIENTFLSPGLAHGLNEVPSKPECHNYTAVTACWTAEAGR